ncbi:MAG: contractile injection system protein, VgrG/Pvc8 family [Sulfurovum sp.]|nr:contractile injection system protein, VgrG/Pvc8 family [Sulfurovum sp.]
MSSAVDALDIAKVSFFDPNSELQENDDFHIGKDISIAIGFDEYIDIFVGEITRIDYIFNKTKTTTVQLICYDKLSKLSKMVHSRPFIKMKDSDIAKQIASEAGLQSSVDSTSIKHDYLFQNNESNLSFLRRRADRLGYELAIEDKKMIFKKARFKDKVPSVDLSMYDTMIDFNAKIDASDIPEEVIVSSWDYVKKEAVEESVKAGSEPKIGSVKTMGTKEVKDNMKNKAKFYRLDIPNLQNGEAKTLAEAKLTDSSMDFMKASGSCEGEPKIKSGRVINISNLGKKLDGEYYIVSCEQIYSSASYRTLFNVISNGMHL